MSLSHLQIAAHQFQSGNFEYAQSLCEKVLETQPDNIDAINLIAMIHFNLGRPDQAKTVLLMAIEKAPNDLRILNNLGNFMKSSGDLKGAYTCYERAVKVDPKCFPALYNLGNVYGALGDSDKAIECYKSAIKIEKNFPDLYYNMGNEQRKQKQFTQARDSYKVALALQPDHAEALTQLGSCYGDLGEFVQAQDCYKRAIAIQPDCAAAHNNLGVAYTHDRKFQEAFDSLSEAVRLDGSFIDARNNLGIAQSAMGKYNDAILTFRNVMSRDPANLGAFRNLAHAYVCLEDWTRACDVLKQAIARSPSFYEALVDLGIAMIRTEGEKEAWTVFSKACEVKPEAFAPRFGKMMTELRSFYENDDEYEKSLKNYELALDEMAGFLNNFDLNVVENLHEAAECVGSIPSFNLLLFERNQKDLQKKLGEFSIKVMSARYPKWTKGGNNSRSANQSRLKVGIVSQHFANHSDWRMLVRGWVSQLSRERFQLYGYSTKAPDGVERDSEYAAQFDSYFASGDLESLAEQISNDGIDVLIYSSVGTDALPYKLACLPLARIQCAGWGSPLTTGLGTIDYFLGSDMLEPADGADHYSEKLVRLPGFGSFYRPTIVEAETSSLEAKGVKKNKKLFLCLQSLNKYLPQHDRIFVEIAKRVPDAQFLFAFRPEHIKNQLEKRLATVFGAAGLDANQFITFLPALSHAEYAGLCSIGQVFLDTPVNSGCLSTLDAFEQAIPVVTLPGKHMRSRHTGGMLERMGVTETIASSLDEYVELAVRLANDPDFHKSISEKIASTRSALYKDEESIRALESFLIEQNAPVLL